MNYRKIIEVEFKEYTEEALEKSWLWLNDPQIKELTNTPDFDKESQRAWYESLKTRTDYFIRSIVYKDQIVGVCGLKKINGIDAEMWAYIGEKEFWGKTIGAQTAEYLIDYGKQIKLESIYAIYLKINKASIKTSKRFGFEYECDLNENEVQLRRML